MHSYNEIDSLILNNWRKSDEDGAFIERFTDKELSDIEQWLISHKKADFRSNNYLESKESVVVDYIRLWVIDLLLMDERDDFQELASILEWY